MTMPISSRSLILNRICTALTRNAIEESPKAPRHYLRRSDLTNQKCIQLMSERLREYEAECVECKPEHLVDAIADRLRASGRRRFVVPPDLNCEWLVPGFDWKIDNGLDHDEIEQCDGVVTAAFAGIAESGTIVLHHSPIEGRRIISLLPDYHLCILRAHQVVAVLPEYFELCTEPPQLVTYISGPSATVDIEMTRVKGVHGPRFLRVILVCNKEG
jgi:L-lactate dehydrogenase complex protein LldG